MPPYPLNPSRPLSLCLLCHTPPFFASSQALPVSPSPLFAIASTPPLFFLPSAPPPHGSSATWPPVTCRSTAECGLWCILLRGRISFWRDVRPVRMLNLLPSFPCKLLLLFKDWKFFFLAFFWVWCFCTQRLKNLILEVHG